MSSDLPWIEKYRPDHIDGIVSHGRIIKILKGFIDRKTLPHLLFFGPSGSGKTSTIICCIKEIYGEYVDIMTMKLNASKERGIDTVRNKIKNFVSNMNTVFLPVEKQDIFKIVILDEIDSMTVEAQGMLRQTIEKYSRTTRFCLICNEIDKINVALQSRCTLFRFSPLKAPSILERLKEICKKEKIAYDKNALDALVSISNGDMRVAINMLQLIGNKSTARRIEIDNVYKMSGNCHPKNLTKIIHALEKISENKQTNFEQTVQAVNALMSDNNVTVASLLREINNYIIKSDMILHKKIYIINAIAQNEIYDSVSVDSRNIIMGIVSAFVLIPA